MPNWTTNNVTIKTSDKESMDKFLNAGKPNKKGNRSEGKYSFESWIPMPRTFHQYDTTNHPNGAHLVVGQPLYLGKESPVVTPEHIEQFKKATAYQKKKYGVVGWYDFGVKYWGTKWNADFDVERISDTEAHIDNFDTAWSAPLEFFEAIAKKYNLHIILYAHYEDNDNQCYIINDPDGGDYYGECDYSEMLEEFLRRIDEDDTLSEAKKETRKKTAEQFFQDDAWYCTEGVDYNWESFNDWYVECVEQEDEDDSEEETENA